MALKGVVHVHRWVIRDLEGPVLAARAVDTPSGAVTGQVVAEGDSADEDVRRQHAVEQQDRAMRMLKEGLELTRGANGLLAPIVKALETQDG